MALSKDDIKVSCGHTKEKKVMSCLDCGSSQVPQLKGFSPGIVLAEREFQLVSMDCVISLLRSRHRNTALLLWQCLFTGFVIANAVSNTYVITVAKLFEECVYRCFEAPPLIRHVRDLRFMSEVFQVLTELIHDQH
ncbi:reverse transcriptase [Phytophthora megakarya]|uniref:Reverse transcriptase n=1 Tax=Phytophthora megakarya TaxID=4795 RepID=A0A225V1Q4_9STRA|nr:reverse transcriptase [Phytophthora megakarya]